MKNTYTAYIKVEIPTPCDQEAQKVAITIANSIGGEIEKLEDTNKLPF